MTEVHVLIYCDCCGELYTEETEHAYADAEGICFDSVNQAVEYLNARSAAVGWFYDGDRVWCDACRAIDIHDNDDRD
ncbi:hypothetical protein [Nocardia sp. NPDC005745]|uniref:hypothetical protein n=1 Tax=Nocardia sp. NPDC005745 TaxID=3157061 RepID=UPI00340E2916